MATVLDVLLQQSPQLQEVGKQFDREFGPGIRALQELGRQFDREFGPGIRALLGGAWDERLAAAVGRLETCAEGIRAAPPESELKTVEALSADMAVVIEAAPAEAREDTKTWLAWLLVFLLDAIAGDPAKEALRHALMKLLAVLFVMVTDPTLPTSSPAPALRQPEALAPMSAPPEAPILTGGRAAEGSRQSSSEPPTTPRSAAANCPPAESAGLSAKRPAVVDRDQIGELTNQVGELTKQVGGLREDVRGLRAASRRDFFQDTAAALVTALGVGSLFHWLGARQHDRTPRITPPQVGSLHHAVDAVGVTVTFSVTMRGEVVPATAGRI